MPDKVTFGVEARDVDRDDLELLTNDLKASGFDVYMSRQKSIVPPEVVVALTLVLANANNLANIISVVNAWLPRKRNKNPQIIILYGPNGEDVLRRIEVDDD